MKHKVLVVDDEEYITQIVKEILTDDLSLEVEVADNGMDGLVCASETVYSIIITDIRMPRMTGLEFVRTLRSRDIPNKNILYHARGCTCIRPQEKISILIPISNVCNSRPFSH